jgi:hypothetical protein
MPPNNADADNIIDAVLAARTSADAAEIAVGLVCAAGHVIAEDDLAARAFLARLMVRVARELDPDAVLNPTTQ